MRNDLQKIKGYNERLFQNGIRAWFHLARFRWLSRKCEEFSPDTKLVIELGCFDARAIDYIQPTPAEYFVFDAGWEGGLDMAIEKYKISLTIISLYAFARVN